MIDLNGISNYQDFSIKNNSNENRTIFLINASISCNIAKCIAHELYEQIQTKLTDEM